MAQPSPIFDTLGNISAVAKSIPEQAKAFQRDFEYAHEFLYSYRGSEATFNAYRREVERMIQWSWLIAKKSLKALHRTDIEQFIAFCQIPPQNWIGIKNVPRFLDHEGLRAPNPEWRPFVVSVSKSAHHRGETPDRKKYQLSQKALQAIFAVLGSFFNYMVQEEYIDVNPVTQIRQKSKFIRKQQSRSFIRRLSELQWAYVIETAELMANENPVEHERTLFMMSILYGMYLRISELAASKRWEPQMGHFHKDMDGNWWFKTVGKGNKERIISVSNAVLDALKRYRVSLGLTPLPSPGETTFLLSKERGKGPISSTRHIRSIVQNCFDQSIEQLKKDGFSEEADMMVSATVHWLRHTGISDDVKTRPREHVRDDAGHGSSAITDKYIDIELRERNASAKNKPMKPE